MFEQRLFGEHCILVILLLHVSLENGQVFLMNFRPSSLHSLLSTLGAKEEIWSVGRMSRNIGDLLESWTPVRNRRKGAENRVSLILVDRTLELASSVMVGQCVKEEEEFLTI